MAPAREHFSLRLDPDQRAVIATLAVDEGRTEADMIRRLLTEAIAARQSAKKK